MENKTSYTVPILVVLLAVAAFLAGVFYMKSQGAQTATGPQPTPSTVAQNPTEAPTVLGAQEVAKLVESAAAVKGPEDAPVTIIEFSEYECPFCKRYFEETYPKIVEKYGDKVRFAFIDYPLPFHKYANKMAEVARAAGEQGKYWEMHDLLFENRDTWAAKSDVTADIASYVAKLGLDKAKFDAALSSGKFTQAVAANADLGKQLGVSGTPTFFVNGQKLVGAQPFESFAKVIDAELAK